MRKVTPFFSATPSSVIRALMILAAVTTSAQIVIDRSSPDIVDRGQIEEFTSYDFVKQRAIAFLRQTDPVAIRRLILAPNSDLLSYNYGHGALHNVSYQSTMEQIERDGLPKGPMARLLALGNIGKFSYFENGQLREEFIGANEDPTVFMDGDYRYELLHFTFSTPEGMPKDKYPVRLFFKASPNVSVSSAVRLYSRLRQLLTVGQLSLYIRTDPWFMGDPFFPAAMLFTKPSEIPNTVRYMIAPSLTCGPFNSATSCSGQNFLP